MAVVHETKIFIILSSIFFLLISSFFGPSNYNLCLSSKYKHVFHLSHSPAGISPAAGHFPSGHSEGAHNPLAKNVLNKQDGILLALDQLSVQKDLTLLEIKKFPNSFNWTFLRSLHMGQNTLQVPLCILKCEYLGIVNIKYLLDLNYSSQKPCCILLILTLLTSMILFHWNL